MSDNNSLKKELTGIKHSLNNINDYLTGINERLVVLEERSGIETAEPLPEKEIEDEKIESMDIKEENGQ